MRPAVALGNESVGVVVFLFILSVQPLSFPQRMLTSLVLKSKLTSVSWHVGPFCGHMGTLVPSYGPGRAQARAFC